MIFENNKGGGGGGKQIQLGKNGAGQFFHKEIFLTCYMGTLRVKTNKVDL